jgi:CRISPR-associated protein Cmr2
MSQSVLLIAIGPVQDFIGQARRSRDLWMGSHLLSEVSRAAARALAEGGAELIFPALKADSAELEPCEGFTRPNRKPPVNVANKILALAPTGREEALAQAAREAARDSFKAFADKVRKQGLMASDCGPLWDEQIQTLLEINAVAVPVGAGGYKAAREEAEAALAARKNLRDFTPWAQQGHGRPKSSLDGARASVLPDKEARKKNKAFGKARINESEQLSAVDLVKRRGGDPDQFVSLSAVALADWLERAQQDAPDQFHALVQACEAFNDLHGREQGLGSIHRSSQKMLVGSAFIYEAQILLESRWASAAEERGLEVGDLAAVTGPVSELVRAARKKGHGAPYPYVASLVADGDRMGAALDGMDTPAAHKNFSTHLARFAVKAREVVEEKFRGLLLYAGGDDVVAVVCLPDALACAKALKELFEACMVEAVPVIPEGGRPTLSVGVGIGHLMEDMSHLLELGREAEKVAKGDGLPAEQQRDALGVVLDKRSGGKLTWRAKWAEAPVSVLAMCQRSAGARRGPLEEGL